jgi:outer membrane protein assembly factor BamD (BamD/ComL family)
MKGKQDMYNSKVFAALLLSSAMVAGCEEGRDNGTGRSGQSDSDEVFTPRSSSQSGTGAQGSQVQVRAQTLIEQVNMQIRSKEFDQAEQSLKELEAMRAQLPQNMQTQIATLRSSLTSARQTGGAGANQPGTTGLPGQQPGQQPSQNSQAAQEAQTLIQEVNQHIRSQEFDEAEEKLSELEDMRSLLPQSLQTQIQTLRASFDRAKAGAGSGTTPPEN